MQKIKKKKSLKKDYAKTVLFFPFWRVSILTSYMNWLLDFFSLL